MPRRSHLSIFVMLFFLFGIAITDLNIVNFAGQPAGRIGRFPVRSGHENLDRFHLSRRRRYNKSCI